MNSIAERTVHVQGLSEEAKSYLKAQARIWQRTHSTQAAVRAANAWADGYRAYGQYRKRQDIVSDGFNAERRDGYAYAKGEAAYWLCISREGLAVEEPAA